MITMVRVIVLRGYGLYMLRFDLVIGVMRVILGIGIT
jgi:hypothetical protein